MGLIKVISGAQIGADIAGLRAAHHAGLETGGWMPNGFRTKTGRLHPEFVELYGLLETPSPKYPPRTELNVWGSDATFRFAYNWYSPGEKLTQKLLTQHQRPRFDVELRKFDDHWSPFGFPPALVDGLAMAAASWLIQENVKILNVAGNADSSIELCVEDFLFRVFKWEELLSNGDRKTSPPD